MSHGVGFAGSAATARRLALPSLDMTVMRQADGRAVGRVADPLVRTDRLTHCQDEWFGWPC